MSGKTIDLTTGGDPACGCCAGLSIATPAAISNRPGLDALAYRVGTHGTFLETMMARLSNLCLEVAPAGGEGEPRKLYPLRALTTRAVDDPSIALLDAWATLAEVLTFYQERIANEGYLRTAVERRSLLELARLVGYAPRPGVAASVYLAFTVDDNYEQVEIPAGTRAQSVPEAGGEMPQFFETGAPLVARSEWNALGVRLTRPQAFTEATGSTTLYLEGTATNLKANDPLCVQEHGASGQVYRVMKVTADAQAGRTAVEIEPWQVIGTAQQAPSPPAPPAAGAASPPSSEEILATVERFLDLGTHGIRGRVMATRVAKGLETFRREVPPDLPPAELARRLTDTVGMVEAEHVLARDRGWRNLASWTADLMAALGAHRDALAAAAEETVTIEAAATAEVTGSSAGMSLSDVIGRLATAPSLQPANPLRLERTVEQVFQAGSQTHLDVLASFRPRIRRTLYVAWEKAVVLDSPKVAKVRALRVRAAPFGATAPLQPVFNDQGAVLGHREWPLASYRIHISGLALTAGGDYSFILHITRNGGQTSSIAAIVSLRDGSEVLTVGGYPVNVGPPEESKQPGLKFSFDFLDPKRSISLRWVADQQVVVTIDEGTDFVRPGSHTRFSVDDDLVFVGWYSDAGIEIALEQQSPPEALNVLPLDAQYDQILPGTCVVVDRADGDLLVTQVESVRTVTKAAYGITGRVTELTLKQDWLSSEDRTLAAIRSTAVYAQAEPVTLAPEPIDPIEEPIEGDLIVLDGLYPGLEPGRWLIVSGERTDVAGAEGVEASEVAMISEVVQGVEEDLPGDTNHTTLKLAEALVYKFKRDTATVHANVTSATHGETREQILGNGDGSQADQSFTLASKPLTHVAAPTPAGAESTLEVRVEDVPWHESANPAALESDDRAYTTLTDDDTTIVTFGDGVHGARLPTGIENVTARYRQGIGKKGNVGAGQISLLATQPLGVRGVTNPLAATGGVDRDGAEAIRRNAPLQVMALDRLVSVRDYADFARTFAGIAKADARLLTDGRRRLVHLTLAGVDDVPIAESSDLLRNLRAALRRFGDPNQPFTVAVRELLLPVISARVRIHPDYLWESVEPDVRSALLETFGFERRALGQDVVLSEVISTIQAVEGVVAADVDVLDRVDENVTPKELESIGERFALQQCIVAELGRVATEPPPTLLPAQLAFLNPDLPDTLILKEWTS